jgi:hypothetical protein
VREALTRRELAEEEMKRGLVGSPSERVGHAKPRIVKETMPGQEPGLQDGRGGVGRSAGERCVQLLQIVLDRPGVGRVDQLEPDFLGRLPGREELEPVPDAGHQPGRVLWILEPGPGEIGALDDHVVGRDDANHVARRLAASPLEDEGIGKDEAVTGREDHRRPHAGPAAKVSERCVLRRRREEVEARLEDHQPLVEPAPRGRRRRDHERGGGLVHPDRPAPAAQDDDDPRVTRGGHDVAVPERQQGRRGPVALAAGRADLDPALAQADLGDHPADFRLRAVGDARKPRDGRQGQDHTPADQRPSSRAHGGYLPAVAYPWTSSRLFPDRKACAMAG